MRKLYLDVDGVLLTRKNVRMADGAIEFIDYALSNFDCYWLTTHCRTNDTCNILKYLSEFIPLDTVDRLAVVKPSLWDTGKTEGIDFNSDFYWLDDFLFEFEKITLEKHYRLNRMIKVNLENHGELKRIQNLLVQMESRYKRYLFLDIDGVLNTGNYSRSLVESYINETDDDGYLFDPKAVDYLRYIINETNAMIVISSSWRLDGMEKVRRLWTNRNMPGEVIGITPHCITRFADIDTHDEWTKHAIGSRGIEVNEWLRRNTDEMLEPYTYAMLDDENDYLLHQADHLILTDPFLGITKEIANQAIKMLK